MITVIVVDDEPITRMDLKEMLEEANFDVAAQGSDGFDAIDLCRQHKPDVVLMDIKMPVFDGLGAAETIIRENLAGCVVILTAYSDREFIEKAKQIGIAGYLVKPVEERTLIPTIEIAIAQSNRYNKAVKSTQEMERRLDEKKTIDRAKMIVAKRDGITEGEAYAQIRKTSMDKRCSMFEIASMIVEGGSERESVEKAKQVLIKRYRIGENDAYAMIKDYCEREGCTMGQAAVEMINKAEELKK